MAKLYFLGIKHSGKTTQARLAAEMLGKTSVDADDLVLSYLGTDSIRTYYKENGKEAFMLAETEAVKAYVDEYDNFIMSLGGGASDNPSLIKILKESDIKELFCTPVRIRPIIPAPQFWAVYVAIAIPKATIG